MHPRKQRAWGMKANWQMAHMAFLAPYCQRPRLGVPDACSTSILGLHLAFACGLTNPCSLPGGPVLVAKHNDHTIPTLQKLHIPSNKNWPRLPAIHQNSLSFGLHLSKAYSSWTLRCYGCRLTCSGFTGSEHESKACSCFRKEGEPMQTPIYYVQPS